MVTRCFKLGVKQKRRLVCTFIDIKRYWSIECVHDCPYELIRLFFVSEARFFVICEPPGYVRFKSPGLC